MRKQAEQMDAAMSAVAELIEAATGLAYEHDALHGECACDGKRDCCACRLRAALAGTGAAAQAHRLGGLT